MLVTIHVFVQPSFGRDLFPQTLNRFGPLANYISRVTGVEWLADYLSNFMDRTHMQQNDQCSHYKGWCRGAFFTSAAWVFMPV